jgi:hypothetical protein
MLAIKLDTDGVAVEVEIAEEGQRLKQLQEAVGGWIEAVDLSPTLTMWCNEEGKLNGLPFNPLATDLWEESFGKTDLIKGNVIFTGGVDDEGSTLGLDEATANKLRKLFGL